MSEADVLVRRARADDIAALGDIHVAAWRQAFGQQLGDDILASLDSAQFAQAWGHALSEHAQDTDTHALLVAVQGGSVVGFAALQPSPDPDATTGDAEITALMVSPDYQRVGHGSRLLAAMTDTATSQAVAALYHWAVTGDVAREAFLASAGFEPDGAWRETPLDPQHTLMERRWVALLERT